MSRRDRLADRAKARRDARGTYDVPDPGGLTPQLATWLAVQGGLEPLQKDPVYAMGCSNGILLIYHGLMGDGVPTRVLQRLDVDFLRKLVPPFSRLRDEWQRRKGDYDLNLDEGVLWAEKQFAQETGMESRRVDGFSAVVLDPDTLAFMRTVLVDKALIEKLSHNKHVPAAPLLMASSDGIGIVVVYENEPGKLVMRADRVPDEEEERLGIERHGSSLMPATLDRLTAHAWDSLAQGASKNAPLN